VEAASEAGVHAVVNMSQIRRVGKPRATPRGKLGSPSGLLNRSALITTHLRPTSWKNIFLDPRHDHGIYRLPFADAGFAPSTPPISHVSRLLQTPTRMPATYQLFGAENSTGMTSPRKSKKPWVSRWRYEPTTFLPSACRS